MVGHQRYRVQRGPQGGAGDDGPWTGGRPHHTPSPGAARRPQETAEWKDEDAGRAAIEGAISEGVRGFGRRRGRSLGLVTAHRQPGITAAAMDRSRLAAWLAGVPPEKTKTSRFAELAMAG